MAGTPHAYKGRVGIHEMLMISDEIRGIIAKGGAVEGLEDAAKKVGYRTLRYDALKKALLGLTTIEEVERTTPQEYETP